MRALFLILCNLCGIGFLFLSPWTALFPAVRSAVPIKPLSPIEPVTGTVKRQGPDQLNSLLLSKTKSVPTALPVVKAPPADPGLVLLGLLRHGEQWVAQFRPTNGGEPLSLGLGQTVDGWTFASATRTSATLVRDGTIWTASLDPAL